MCTVGAYIQEGKFREECLTAMILLTRVSIMTELGRHLSEDDFKAMGFDSLMESFFKVRWFCG